MCYIGALVVTWGVLLPFDVLQGALVRCHLGLCGANIDVVVLFRNILSIDSQLNRIDRSTNIIFPPNAERGYRTKLEILLEVVFQYNK